MSQIHEIYILGPFIYNITFCSLNLTPSTLSLLSPLKQSKQNNAKFALTQNLPAAAKQQLLLF